MKRSMYYLLICLFLMACGKGDDSPNDNRGTDDKEITGTGNAEDKSTNTVANELLWGTWTFSYATNTMVGTRSYTFDANGNYSFLDEWVALDSEGHALSPYQDKHHGTYSVPIYKKTGDNTAEGEIIVGEKRMAFSIAQDGTSFTYLLLGNESYIKETVDQP